MKDNNDADEPVGASTCLKPANETHEHKCDGAANERNNEAV
ncbi:hypothetical protein [Aridibaculum aurantiacum]|nr:hypothetical protein [Aridibaculum aurantiacum]